MGNDAFGACAWTRTRAMTRPPRALLALLAVISALASPVWTTAAGAQTASPYLSFRVWATAYAAHDPQSAEVALPDKCVKFASLGQTANLATFGCGPGYQPGMNWNVRVTRDNGTSAVFPVRDVGPWNIDDNYWDPAPGSNHPRTRRLFADLPRGLPQAQAAFDSDHNLTTNCNDLNHQPTDKTDGADQFGRCVLNRAGIDLSLAAAAQIGMTGSQWLTVEFLWEPAQGGYVLDGFGGLHGFNGSPRVGTEGYFPGWDIVRAVAVRPDGISGYTVDGYGGIHRFAPDPASVPKVSTTGYWPNFDIARGVALVPGDATRGYTLDGWGGLHPFGGAPPVAVTGYFPGQDVVKAVVVNPATEAFPHVTGYTLGARGSIMPFAEVGKAMPPKPAGPAFSFDIARGITLSGSGKGYVLDGFGGIHAFGGAQPAVGGPYWSGYDIARSLIYDPAIASGYVVDGRGGLHSFNSAPKAQTLGYFSFDIVSGIGGAGQ